MSETFSKKENIKKKAKKKEQKLQLREDRKSNNNKGKSLDDMMVYIDENGNFTSVPQDPKNKTEISVENIQLGAAPIIKEDSLKKGKITFFSEKGFGFITDERSQERYFVHRNDMIDQADLNDKVTFEVERRERGLVAIDVKLLK
jgi:CspA family cold shock protein